MAEAFSLPFHVRTPAKWVLAGEHTVLRGGSAIAFPHPELGLTLRFTPGGAHLRVEPEQAEGVVAQAIEIARGLDLLPNRAAPSDELGIVGELRFESTIPLGAGLGSSAALAVALAKWLCAAEPAKVPALAKAIEDQLHGGTSSGMDVAAILADGPIEFRSGHAPLPLSLRRLPRFTLHDTGVRQATASCIAKVADLRRSRAEDAAALDARMAEASRLALDGLRRFASGEAASLAGVAAAMAQAQDCFARWGLEPPEAKTVIAELKSRGALGAKLTGAGGGGMVVALWSGQ